MNRRDLFKFAGLAAVTPLAPLALKAQDWDWGSILARSNVQTLLPDDVLVPNEAFRFLEYLKELELRQLGIRDLAELRTIKAL